MASCSPRPPNVADSPPVQSRQRGPMRIGELASATGIPADTVRYYERIGLLPTPARRGGGYRKYAPDDVFRLQAIRGAKALGLSLEAIRTLVEMARPHARPPSVRACAKALQQELAERCRVLQALSTSVQHCRNGPPATVLDCPILATLQAYAQTLTPVSAALDENPTPAAPP